MTKSQRAKLREIPLSVAAAGICFLLAASVPLLVLPVELMWGRLALALVLSAIFASSIFTRHRWGRVLIFCLCAWQIIDHFIMGFNVQHWLEHAARVLDALVVVLLMLPASRAWFRTALRPRHEAVKGRSR